MIFAGISMAFGAEIPFFGTGLISGLWLAFIGWFLSSASAQSYHQVVIQDILRGVPAETLSDVCDCKRNLVELKITYGASSHRSRGGATSTTKRSGKEKQQCRKI